MAQASKILAKRSLRVLAKDDPKPVVGFLGVGAIGAPMARRVRSAGYEIVVYDTRPAAAAKFQKTAQLATSPQEVAERADVIIGCLPTSDAYRDSLLGPWGIVRGARVRTYLHAGTTGAALIREVAKQLAKYNVATLDAAMSGSPKLAAQGKLTVLASGLLDTFEVATPILKSYANRVLYMGGAVGMAQTMKVLNNAVSLVNLASACEAMVFGAKLGLEPTMMLEALNISSGENWATRNVIGQYILSGTFDFGGLMHIVKKDLKEFIDEGARSGLTTSLAAAALNAYLEAAAQGSDSDDWTMVIRPMERVAGVEVRVSNAKS